MKPLHFCFKEYLIDIQPARGLAERGFYLPISSAPSSVSEERGKTLPGSERLHIFLALLSSHLDFICISCPPFPLSPEIIEFDKIPSPRTYLSVTIILLASLDSCVIGISVTCKASCVVNMKPQTIIFLVFGLFQSAVGLKAPDSPGIIFLFPISPRQSTLMSKQACMSQCWNNTKFVSACAEANKAQCLCTDAGFQSVRTPSMSWMHLKCIANIFQVVLQCLYSQCQTTRFGTALHQVLSACTDYETDTLDASPPIIRHQGLRKRGSPSNVYASGHLSATAAHSVARRSFSVSAYVNSRPTRSAGLFATHSHDVPPSSMASRAAKVSSTTTHV